MNGAIARQINAVLYDAVTGQESAVRKDTAVPDAAIMCDMAIGHEKILAADVRRARSTSAAMDSDVFAEDIAIADVQGSRLVIVFEMLGILAEDCPAENEIALSQSKRAPEISVGSNDATRTDLYLAFDNAVSANLHIGSKNSLR